MEFRLSHSTDVELIAVPYRLTIPGSRVSIEKGQSNVFLQRLQAKKFTTLYGELLRVAEEQLSLIPFRPQIESSGCEIVKRVDQPEWLLMWEVRKPRSWPHAEDVHESNGSILDVVHIVQDGVVPVLDRAQIADLFNVPITECCVGIWEQKWKVDNLDERQYAQHKRGRLMNEAEGRRALWEQHGAEANRSESVAGFELELSVAESLHNAGLWFRSGVETPFGELDHIVAILDSLVLIECKTARTIGMTDIQVLVSRAASIGADYAFLFTTMPSENLHPNVREALKQLRRSGQVYVMVLFIRDLEAHIDYWVSEICSIIGFAMIDNWIVAEESHSRRSPLWKMDGNGNINGFDRLALSEYYHKAFDGLTKVLRVRVEARSRSRCALLNSHSSNGNKHPTDNCRKASGRVRPRSPRNYLEAGTRSRQGERHGAVECKCGSSPNCVPILQTDVDNERLWL
jgi:hypothetical protein